MLHVKQVGLCDGSGTIEVEFLVLNATFWLNKPGDCWFKSKWINRYCKIITWFPPVVWKTKSPHWKCSYELSLPYTSLDYNSIILCCHSIPVVIRQQWFSCLKGYLFICHAVAILITCGWLNHVWDVAHWTDIWIKFMGCWLDFCMHRENFWWSSTVH